MITVGKEELFASSQAINLGVLSAIRNSGNFVRECDAGLVRTIAFGSLLDNEMLDVRGLSRKLTVVAHAYTSMIVVYDVTSAEREYAARTFLEYNKLRTTFYVDAKPVINRHESLTYEEHDFFMRFKEGLGGKDIVVTRID